MPTFFALRFVYTLPVTTSPILSNIKHYSFHRKANAHQILRIAQLPKPENQSANGCLIQPGGESGG